MKKIPVGATIAHAYRFACSDFLKILAVIWLPLLIMWGPGLLLQPQMMALSGQFASHNFSGLGRIWPLLLVFYIAAFILLFMQVIGVAQLALGLRRGSAWFYFSLNRPLWRLIGSWLLLIVAMIIGWLATVLGGLLLGLLLGLIAKLVNNVLMNGLIAVLVGLAIIALWCGYIYAWIRLSFLLLPIVVAEPEGFALARSWMLGFGNFWRMFAILLVILLPFLALEGIFIFGFMFRDVPFPPSHASAAQVAAYQAAMSAHTMAMMQNIYRYWYITYPLLIGFTVLLFGLAVGGPCFAYRSLAEADALAPVAGDALPNG